MTEPTPAQFQALVDAVWYALDDMGKDGHSVCEGTKALLRYHFEPFNGGPTDEQPDYSLATAEAVLREVDLLPKNA